MDIGFNSKVENILKQVISFDSIKVIISDTAHIEVFLSKNVWYDEYTYREIGAYLASELLVLKYPVLCLEFRTTELGRGGDLCMNDDFFGLSQIRFDNCIYRRMFIDEISSTGSDDLVKMNAVMKLLSRMEGKNAVRDNIWNVIFDFSKSCKDANEKKRFENLIVAMEYDEFNINTSSLRHLLSECNC